MRMCVHTQRSVIGHSFALCREKKEKLRANEALLCTYPFCGHKFQPGKPGHGSRHSQGPDMLRKQAAS